MEEQQQFLANALDGKGAHVVVHDAFDGFDLTLAEVKPHGTSHSVWDLLNHLNYWQDYALALLNGDSPELPEHAAESWQTPAFTEQSWSDALSRLFENIDRAKEHAALPLYEQVSHDKKRFELIMGIIGHNSYHLGQIVQLRRMLGSWPPPSGGDTW
jgi:uncharacterized damage-inducible protein DinB